MRQNSNVYKWKLKSVQCEVKNREKKVSTFLLVSKANWNLNGSNKGSVTRWVADSQWRKLPRKSSCVWNEFKKEQCELSHWGHCAGTWTYLPNEVRASQEARGRGEIRFPGWYTWEIWGSQDKNIYCSTPTSTASLDGKPAHVNIPCRTTDSGTFFLANRTYFVSDVSRQTSTSANTDAASWDLRLCAADNTYSFRQLQQLCSWKNSLCGWKTMRRFSIEGFCAFAAGRCHHGD